MDKPFMSNNGVFHGFCPFLNVFFLSVAPILANFAM